MTESSKPKIINETKFVKSYFNQDYFLWHSAQEFEADYINPLILPNEKDELLEDDEYDESDIGSSIWTRLINENLDTSVQTVNAQSNIFASIQNQLNLWATNELFSGLKYKIVSPKGDLKTRINETNKLLADSSCDVIINGYFGYEIDEFVIYTNPFAFSKLQNKLYLSKLSTHVKIDTLLSLKFAYEILQKQKIQVNNAYVIIVDSQMPQTQGICKFVCTELCHMSRNKYTFDKEAWDTIKQALNDKMNPYFKDRKAFINYMNQGWALVKNELSFNKHNGKLPKTFNYVECLKKNYGLKSIKNADKRNNFFKFDVDEPFDSELYLGDFDRIINRIISAYSITKPDLSFFDAKTDDNTALNNDYNHFGKNDLLAKDYLLASLGKENIFNRQIFSELRINLIANNKAGRTFNKAKENFIEKVQQSYKTGDFFKSLVIEKYLSELHIKDQKIVWYDYESFMSLLPVIDDFSPYSQIVNQVSIIDTINGKIITNTQEDIVYDPKNISIFNLISILKNLYDRQGDKYIVYNKGFENTRNMEIATWAQNHNFDESFIKELNEKLSIKPDDVMTFANYINSRTIDLYELFSRPSKKIKFDDGKIYQNIHIAIDESKLNSNIKGKHNSVTTFSQKGYIIEPKVDKQLINFTINDVDNQTLDGLENPTEVQTSAMSSILNLNVFLKDLKGMGSIKKVEHLITSKKIQLEHMITPYPDLKKVHNGSEAMEIAIKRYANLIDGNVWEENLSNLKKYCHNDVLAMIMAFNFIEKIVSDIFPEINELKYTFNNSYQYLLNRHKWQIEVINYKERATKK